MTTATLRLPPRIARLPQLRQIVRGGLAARGSVGAGLAAKAGGVTGNGLLNSLVAYWPLNEAAGANNALDLHSNGLTLTQTASPGSAAGVVYSGARTFNGSSQYFSRASETLLQTGDVDFTFALWMYGTSTADYANALTKGRYSVEREYEIAYVKADGKMYFTVYSAGTGYSVAALLSLNAWQLVICQHDSVANVISIQINAGVPVTAAHSLGNTAGTQNFEIGRLYGGSSSYWWKGSIGPVAMWKSAAGLGGALSATQRSQLYNSGAGLAYSAFTT